MPTVEKPISKSAQNREILFYHLEASTPFEDAPKLLMKAYKTGLKTLVLCPDTVFRDRLDQVLWTFEAESFLPHGTVSDTKNADKQPILLSSDPVARDEIKLVLVLDGADIPITTGFERAFVMFDSRNSSILSKVRKDWVMCKEHGFNLSYWQKTSAGGWEKKSSHTADP